MANNIGTLLVELGINTAAFVEGMDKATYKAKQGAKDIADAFDQMGSSLRGVLGQFGELGEAVGGIFESLSSQLSGLAGGIGSLGGAMGALGVGAAASVAAIGAVVGAVDALTIKSAESAAQLYQMSLKTGVSVETLSVLGFAAKETGVSTETLAKSLELMNKSAYAAEIAPAGATNAYTRLGITVTDAAGHLKDSSALFDEVIAKLANLQNAGERIALTKAIFGRGGVELTPLIMEAGEGLDELKQKAVDLGQAMSTDTAKAAEEFERDLTAIGTAGTGVGNQLLSELLPAFKAVSSQMIEGLKSLLALIKEYGPEIVTVTQYFLSFADLTWTVIKQVYDVVVLLATELIVLAETIYNAAAAIAHWDMDAFKKSFSGGLDDAKASLNTFLTDSKKDWTDYSGFLQKVFADGSPTPKRTPAPTGTSDTSQSGPDKLAQNIQSQIDHYQALANAKLTEAAASGQSVAATNLAKAAAQAAVEIQKLDAEASKATGAERAKLTAMIDKNRLAIVAWAQEAATADLATKTNQGLSQETDKLEEQNQVLGDTADAYRKGGQAIVDAQVAAKLEPDINKIAELTEQYALLSRQQGVTEAALKPLAEALATANAQFELHQALVKQGLSLELAKQIAEQTNALKAEAAAYDIIGAAALDSAAAQREAAAQAAAAKFKIANPAADDKTVKAVHDNTLQSLDLQFQATVRTTAAQYDLNKSYEDEIDKLTKARDLIKQKGDDTLAIDAAIFDAQNKINKQWDDAAMKVGDFSQKAAAGLNELVQEGQNFWGSFEQDGLNAFNSLEGAISKFVVTGKGGFKQILQGFEQSSLTTGIKSLTSKAAGSILDNTGLGGLLPDMNKPDGSNGAPFNVVVKNTSEFPGMSGGGGAGPIAGAASSIIPGGGGGGLFGSILSGILGFIPGLADGGDVTPGKAYVVGENHPEFFVPKTSGTIVPSMKMSSGGNVNHFHFHGVQDFDSFKKNKTQVSQSLTQSVSQANGRR
jgi:lambda family phage tail tape measure protein